MSLLQRMERAQAARAAEAAKAAGAESAAPPVDTNGNGHDPGPPVATAPITPPAARPAERTTRDTPLVPVGPAPLSGLMKAGPAPVRDDLIRDVRLRLQKEVVNAFEVLLETKDEDVQQKIEPMVDRVIAQNGFAVTREERGRLVEEMVHDVTGFGPLEPLLADPTITEVMVNGPDHIYIERRGKIQRIDSVFLNNEHVLRIIDRIITPLGRRIDETSPRVDARLPDGSRVNAVIEPLSLVGPVITVRKFAQTPFTVDDLIKFGTATPTAPRTCSGVSRPWS